MSLPILDLMLPKVPTSSNTNIISSSVSQTTYQIITGETTITVSAGKFITPITATLTSSDGTRKIEYSTDKGATYYLATYTQNPAGQLVTHFDFPVTTIKATGIAGDKLTIAR